MRFHLQSPSDFWAGFLFGIALLTVALVIAAPPHVEPGTVVVTYTPAKPKAAPGHGGDGGAPGQPGQAGGDGIGSGGEGFGSGPSATATNGGPLPYPSVGGGNRN